MGKRGEEWLDSLEREEGRPARRHQTAVLHTVVSSGEKQFFYTYSSVLLSLLVVVSALILTSVALQCEVKY